MNIKQKLSHVDKCEIAMRVVPSAGDFWLGVAILIEVLGKEVPWYVWVLLFLNVVHNFIVADEVRKRRAAIEEMKRQQS